MRDRFGQLPIWLLPAILVGWTPMARADTPATVLVVFDGSGSMWGRIGGSQNPKHAVAREALRTSLATLKPGTRVGLASFGHRRQGDCSDVEIMLAPEPYEPGRIFSPLDKLNPKGKGPISKALRDAATALKAAPGAKHIVLVHDDVDNCQQDPCQAAAEINAADPSIRIHVVSLVMKTDDPARPVCLAKLTGGKALAGEDAAEAAKSIASVVQSLELAPPANLTTGTGVGTATAAVSTSLRVPTPSPAVRPPITSGPPRLRLAAGLKGTTGAVDAALRWRVSAIDQEPSVVAESFLPTPELLLPAGRYRVDLDSSLIKSSRDVMVAPAGATEVVFELDAGRLTLAATPRRGDKASQTALMKLSRSGGDGEILWIGQSIADRLLLPPGDFAVRIRDGEAEAQRTFKIVAGASLDLEVPLEAGRLRLAAAAREGGPPLANVVYSIVEDDPEAPQGQREIASSSAAAPDFVLPTGSYTVVVRQDGVETRERVVILPGDDLSRVLVLGVGRLRLAVGMAVAADAADAAVTFDVSPMEAGPKRQYQAADGRILLELQAGHYRVGARVGGHNARMDRTVEIKPGSEVAVPLDVPAGRVEFRIAPSAVGLFGADLLWEISDQAGSRIWSTLRSNPKAILAPGRYTVAMQGRDRKAAKTFEVRHGEAVVLEFLGE